MDLQMGDTFDTRRIVCLDRKVKTSYDLRMNLQLDTMMSSELFAQNLKDLSL